MTAWKVWLSTWKKNVSLLWNQWFSREDWLRLKVIEMSPMFPLKPYEQRQVQVQCQSTPNGIVRSLGFKAFCFWKPNAGLKIRECINHMLLKSSSFSWNFYLNLILVIIIYPHINININVNSFDKWLFLHFPNSNVE